MSWLTNVPALARARAVLRARARAVWDRDRSPLRGTAALANRSFRIAILVGRGLLTHRLGLQAAALTYYTVFSIVPMLVVVIWALKALDYLPVISPELPANVPMPTGNQLLVAALGRILDAVHKTSEIASGVVGLVALLYAVSKMFGYTERALHMIAASGQRAPRFSRLLVYVALMFLPPALLALSGLVLTIVRRSGSARAIPGLELLVGTALGLGALWMAVTFLYSAAVRARIPFRSAALGAAAAAPALVVVFWVFARFQIGVSSTGTVQSGFLAVPVFLLWVSSCWFTVLVGAEIAVAHNTDRVLVHGAAAFHLDCVGERETGAAIMVAIARAACVRPETPAVTEEELARALRLPPHLIRDLCFRLVARGFLSHDARGFALSRDPARTTVAAVTDAVDRDPALEGRRPYTAGADDGRVTLAELTGEPPRARSKPR